MPHLPFHPLINAWFADTYGKPTPVQEEAWPLIARGEHVLALAPTGSGKTLTGFLAAISRFAEGIYPADKLSVLYVSPLKALNEDIRRNLILPLEGIKARFEKAEESLPEWNPGSGGTRQGFPAIRVETRSGDTPQSERRRFLLKPPSILILTPESLGIILLNPKGAQALSTVRYVILDEIHTALGSKRGCYLSCQIDRLALVAGEFQRVALSATVKPPEAAADFAGGLIKTTGGYVKRKVSIVAPPDSKELKFRVVFPDEMVNAEAKEENPDEKFTGVERYGKRYTELVRFIIERTRAGKENGSKSSAILVFTDSRRRAERISYLLNRTAAAEADYAGRPLAYCHHGSLSKEVRRAVEKSLSSGEISCVVATGSLELGIDIGSVDEVILAGSPGSVAIALQRVGRSGHSVGMTSRGWLIPFHGMDLLQAAALSGAVGKRELEEIKPIENPLDILAQIILAFTTERDWNEVELYEIIRGFYVYQNLSRKSYDGVVRMLAGAYEDTRLRELRRQIFRDEKTGTLSAAPGALTLLYTSGGVIALRGLYSLRLASNGTSPGTKIGELDEEFVWERRLGDCFDFGNRSWKIISIGSEAVEVVPLSTGADYTPFWKGETFFRSPVLSRRILEILDGYNRQQGGHEKEETVLSDFSDEAREALENFLSSQRSCQVGIPLPGPSFIPVEIIDDPAGRGDACMVILHSFRGGAINFPLSLALAQDIEGRYGIRSEGTADDNAVFIRIPRSIEDDPALAVMDSIRRLCEEKNGEARFMERLESSGIFGAAFREAAERSMLLPRSPFGRRIPLWVIRQKSKRLFDAVSPYRDFPVSAEAWRSCLREQFDMAGFAALLDDIRNGSLTLDFFKTRQSSPFSRQAAWAETNVLIYEYDERPDLLGPPSRNAGTRGPSLSDEVIAEALGNSRSRPPLKAELTGSFCSRLKRELPGWAPEDSLTLSEWVKERIAIPADGPSGGKSNIDAGSNKSGEWEILLNFIPAQLMETLREDMSLGGKLEFIKREKAETWVVVHREWAKKWKEAGAVELARDCLGQWLRYEGPIPLSKIMEVFGLSLPEAEDAINTLVEAGEVVRDVIVEGMVNPDGQQSPFPLLVCDRENLELLLRLSRRKQRPEVKERPAPVLIPFLARRQGLFINRSNDTPLADKKLNIPGTDHGVPWKRLAGISAPAKLWETEFFPCRCPSYSGEMLDREIREGRLIWYGTGREKTAFCDSGDPDLVLPWPELVPLFSGRLKPDFFDTPRSFWEIKDALEQQTINNCDTMSGTERDAPILDSVAEALWEEVWKGRLSADSFEPLRRAIEMGFTSAESSINARLAESSPGRESTITGRRSLRVPRAIRERWRTGPPVRGNWFSLAPPDHMWNMRQENAVLEEEELNRDRLRLLLKRWGILARPLLEHEEPELSWSTLLPTMRRMELSGELVAGRFFGGVNSLQFASPRIALELEEAEAEQGIFWMNAADPASPAGLDIEGILYASRTVSPDLSRIRRVPSTRLCFRGTELLAALYKGGKELEIFIPPDDPDIASALAFVKIPRMRKIQPESKITIEKINEKTAAASPYSETLAALGFVKDRGKMVLW